MRRFSLNDARVRRGLFCALAALGLRPAAVGADSVTDDRGVFAGVTVVGMTDGKLAFKFADGRVLERPVLLVRAVSLPLAADKAADELSRSESLRRQRRFDEAAPLLERCRSVAEHEWLKEYATFRLIEAYDTIGRFADAAECYLTIAERHPSLVRECVPHRVKASGPDDVGRVTRRLDELSGKRQSASVSEAIERLRRVLAGESGKDDEGAAASQKAGKGRTANPKSRPIAKTPPRAVYLPKTQRLTAGVYKAMEAGKSDEAWSRIEKGLKAATDRNRDIWWLAEAEFQLAVGDGTRCALAAMKIYALCPDSAYVGEALLLAGQGYERVRPSKARSLYELCIKHATSDDAMRRRAQERMDAMARTAASQPAGHGTGAASRPG